MKEQPGKIRTRDLALVFMRSFLIQASWSFERMQSLGFAFAMQPALKRLYPDKEEYRRRLNLHMEYFNTQPYLASFILGAAVRLEEDGEAGRNRTDLSQLKNTLMAPLGALGDSFFWGALKPLSVVTAAALLMAGVAWAPLVFLLFYNLWHVVLRYQLLVWGYRSRGDAVWLMSHYSFTRMARLFKAVTLVVLGGIVGMTPVWRPELTIPFAVPALPGAAAGLLLTLLLSALLKTGGTPLKLMLGLAAACLALAYAGVA